MPVIIEDLSIGEPMNHARIGYENFVSDATVTATSETTDFPANAIKNPFTYESWKPSVDPATLDIVFDSSKLINYVGLSSQDITGTINIKNGTTTIATYAATGVKETILFLLEDRNITNLKIEIIGSGTLGVVYAGSVLEMVRPFFADYAPPTLSRSNKVLSNMSEGGEFLGNSIIRKGLKDSIQWENLPAQWYRDNFDPFVEDCQTQPFFIAWNPLRYPDDVIYAQSTKMISPKLNGIMNLMDVSMTMKGLA